jgi:aminopeptidase-like protein
LILFSLLSAVNYKDIPPYEHLVELFPICRSITGPGIKKTLAYFESYFPEFERISFASGTQVYDWTVPDEWSISDSYLQHLDTGHIYAPFKASNLHVVGYSEPIDIVLPLEELMPRIFTLSSQPEYIPYVTSYYKKTWGFCMSHSELKTLPSGDYRAFINSTLEPGTLDLTHALVKGKMNAEVFFSSYVCHPSLANNELSGPVVLASLLSYIKEKYPFPLFSYRFSLLPETIGSICYLSLYGSHLSDNMICGFNLSCVGDDERFSYIHTPYANTVADDAIQASLIQLDDVVEYSFLSRGSDERQYCSPPFNLPLVTFCRSKFGTYPEYHTSADNLDFVSPEGLEGSIEVLKSIIDALEICLYPLAIYPCEPQLGKRNLYPSTSIKSSFHPAQLRLDILAYSNGSNSIFQIAKILDQPLKIISDEIKRLIQSGLIKASPLQQ